ncbi:hypothetical protein FisN_11Hh068 [Fistulifera solaris]|uniref:Uncharacterized protein n=1 Tax=Fistulifera solaris TaxID=1519565 RepID=A0A1Z5JL31_FISSO|nr:hypothetical protein FisN_11Hh068 [Fistulifera solaris]|eukprot:GAX14471.1 hypothetical protein FisN_11Hh068 [Fistulifera solaris]
MSLSVPTQRAARSASFSSDEGSHSGYSNAGRRLEQPVLVYHESARSIVFRDHLRRAVGDKNKRMNSDASVNDHFTSPLPHKPLVALKDGKQIDQAETIGIIATEILDPNDTVLPSEAGIPESQICGYRPHIEPLPGLDFGPNDEFTPLKESRENADWTEAEREVVDLFEKQQCVVKTLKGTDWTDFLHRFCHYQKSRTRAPNEHEDQPPDETHPFNSFVTSTSLLPRGAKKMRCYGSPVSYPVGVVFALPDSFPEGETENSVATKTETWAWPSGYSAKTEFNIDGRGKLINGRREALVSLSRLREYNDEYLTKDEYTVGFRKVSGLNQIPYNEVYVRIGGVGRLVNGRDCTGRFPDAIRSFDRGVGLPIALFVRTATYGDLITLLRTRARLMHVLGEQHFKNIPLLLITPEEGVKVLTSSLQHELWKVAARNLNPFQNTTIAHKTTIDCTDNSAFQQKVDELLDLDEDIQSILTPEELSHIAGGFGATDESVASILKHVMSIDRKINNDESSVDSGSSHMLQDFVNEGLASALRAGDYHTSRQLLILYSLVASQRCRDEEKDDFSEASYRGTKQVMKLESVLKQKQSLIKDGELIEKDAKIAANASKQDIASTGLPEPPPPPPLDTDRLRSATNSDGLLAVLGAAQVLRAMQDGSAKKRVEESVNAVEEWVNYGEQSVAFRLASWYDLVAAQGDLKINTAQNSSFMAFVSNKAIANRRAFAQQLRDAVSATDFTDIRFLQAIHMMVQRMHSPCLRLELLQYVLGLDNRYSIAHVARSIELAATCLDISSH